MTVDMPTEENPVVVVEGDALAAMRAMPDCSVDTLITDPPYCAGAVSEAQRTAAKGQGLRSENLRRFGWFTGDNMTTAGLVYLLRAVAFEAVRVVKPTGSLVVFCDWRLATTLSPAVESAGVRFQGEIIWNKGCMGLGNGFRKQHEKALHFTFGEPEYHARDVPDLLTAPRVRGDDREHQTQKPVSLLKDIIRVTCPPGGVVLDPFAGSGSTGIAAVDEGMRCVLVERDAEHCLTIRRRVAEAMGLGEGSLLKTLSAPSLFGESS